MRRVARVVVRCLVVLAAVAGASLATAAPPASADDDQPAVFDIEFNRFCSETVQGARTVPGLDDEYGDGETWTDLRIRDLDPGQSSYNVTDGVVSVDIEDFDGTSFAWTSNIPLDGVFVNAGSSQQGTAAHRLYRYAPEAVSDEGVTSATGTTTIDHVSFCYDLASASQTFPESGNRFCRPRTQPNGSQVIGLDLEHGGGETWVDMRKRNLSPSTSTYTVNDGVVKVQILNFDGYRFDWTSTVPLDGVFVYAPGANQFSRYQPEALSDAGVTSRTGAAQIREISFCYDLSNDSQAWSVAGNRDCRDSLLLNGKTLPGLDTQFGGGEVWSGPRKRNLASAPSSFTVTDGVVAVYVDNFDGYRFDWTSSIPLDGVFVNAGAVPDTAHRFYRYAPEATSGAGLTSSTGTTPIDHLAFCYDLGSSSETFDIAFNRFCQETVVGAQTVPGLDDEFGDGETWSDLRVRDLQQSQPAYTVSDGVVTVEIVGFDGYRFSWTSNVPLDGVFVNAGSSEQGTAAHRFYRYGPEAVGDDNVTSSDATTLIDHVSFCYDLP